MTQMQLIQHIATFDNQFRITKLRTKLKEEPFSLSELVDLTFFPDEAVALKASRILEYIVFKFPQNYCEDLACVVDRATGVKLTGCKKHYAKILMHVTSPDVPRQVRDALKDINFEPIVELCFEWLLNTKNPAGIRASSAQALFNMRHRYPWIAEALSNHLEAMMPDASPMLQAKGNYILSYLHPED